MNTSDNENKCCYGRGALVAVAVMIACLIFAGLVWKMRQYTTPEALGAQRATERAKELADRRAADADALNNVGWVDQAKGIVRIPIEEAKQLAIREGRNPAQARSNLLERVVKANAKPPEKPSAFE
jgi:hypothetical protein